MPERSVTNSSGDCKPPSIQANNNTFRVSNNLCRKQSDTYIQCWSDLSLVNGRVHTKHIREHYWFLHCAGYQLVRMPQHGITANYCYGESYSRHPDHNSFGCDNLLYRWQCNAYFEFGINISVVNRGNDS